MVDKAQRATPKQKGKKERESRAYGHGNVRGGRQLACVGQGPQSSAVKLYAKEIT